MLSVIMDMIKQYLPDWPEWALDILLIMSGLLIVSLVATSVLYTPKDIKDDKEATSNGQNGSNGNGDNTTTQHTHQLHNEFNAFRKQYLIVYLIIMLADWMQGTHMYTLYLSYNVNISALFLTGFLSGAFFAPFLGSAVDKFGRKNSCVIYCVLEIIINLLEHSTNFTILLIGRVLGGISTNLLFSAFESWMTTEHRKKGFPEEWLSRTYSQTSIGNGAMAILAGIVAQILEDLFGHIGPFQGAITLTVIALLLVLQWDENYGEDKQHNKDHEQTSLYDQFIDGWKTTISNSNVWRIGMTQALSEGAMYTFVFMWVPTLLSMDPPGGLPTGCVFSAMMMAITIGGVMYPPLQDLFGSLLISQSMAPELFASFIYCVAAISMYICSTCLSGSGDGAGSELFSDCFTKVIIGFMVVECCVGLFNPVAGTLRSKYVPDSLQGAILNIFRLPLNAVVVSGTYATDIMPAATVFQLVSGCFLAASLLQASMIFLPAKVSSTTATAATTKKQD